MNPALAGLSGQTLASLRGLLTTNNMYTAQLKKAGFTSPTSAVDGIANYDLEPRAKMLFPVITPIRNMVPRLQAKGGIQANWRGITGINTTHISPGVSEGNRNAFDVHTYADYTAKYVELGGEDYVTWKAEYAAEYFDDLKAICVDNRLLSTMISEEMTDLGGNASLSLGTTPTPSLTASTSGGSLATAAAYSVICVALGFDGYTQVAGVNDGTTGESVNVGSAALVGQVSRTNADGSSDTYGGGVAQKSANATVATTGPNASISATVTAVTGAVAYAWFWASAAGSEVLGAVTTINSVVIKATAAGTVTAASLPSSDQSTNTLIYDGLLTMNAKGLGSYYSAQPTGTAGTGTPLTSDGAAGIVEFNTAFQSFWSLYRLHPDCVLVNSQEAININSKVVAGGGAPLFRFQMAPNGATTVIGGVAVAGLMNKATNRTVRLEIHPFMPPGTVLFFKEDLREYPRAGIQKPLVKRLRYDYRAFEWPMVKRRREYGVYFDGVLQNYFFPAFGTITNIANG
jgi:hypothetical protein